MIKTVKYIEYELWHKIHTAREQVAGDNVQSKSTVACSLTTAIVYANNVHAPKPIVDKLIQCREQILQAKTLNDRLKIDDILCGMLNTEITEE